MKRKIFLTMIICMLLSLSLVSAGWSGLFGTNSKITGNIVDQGLAHRVAQLENKIQELEKRLDACNCPEFEIEDDEDDCIKMCDLDSLKECGLDCQSDFDSCIFSEGATAAPSEELIERCQERYKDCLLNCDAQHCKIVCKDNEYYICFNKCMEDDSIGPRPTLTHQTDFNREKRIFCMNYCMRTEETPKDETDYCETMCEKFDQCQDRVNVVKRDCENNNEIIYARCFNYCEDNEHVLERTRYTSCERYCESQLNDCELLYNRLITECNKYKTICENCEIITFEYTSDEPIKQPTPVRTPEADPRVGFLNRLFG